MKKKAISMLLAAAMVFSLAACGAKSDSDTKETKKETTTDAKDESSDKEITVVATGSFYPISYTDDDGNLTGFEVEALKEVCKRADIAVNWELSDDYSAMFGGVDSGKYDTIVGQVSVTDERKKAYQFTDVYAENSIKMCVRGDDPAESVDDLQGRKVCIEFGTVLQDFFDKYNAEHSADEQIECVETAGNIYEELEVGHYDAFPITELSFDSVMEKGEYDFKLIGDPVIIDYQAWPFAKDADPEIIKAINKSIKEMQDDGTLSKLSEKFYGRDVTQITAE